MKTHMSMLVLLFAFFTLILADQRRCEKDVDCVPVPSCHPQTCINEEYLSYYTKPEACTELFDCSAAYTKEDCGCRNYLCFNRNEGNRGCDSDQGLTNTNPSSKMSLQTQWILIGLGIVLSVTLIVLIIFGILRTFKKNYHFKEMAEDNLQ